MRASRIRSRPPAGVDLNTYAARGRTSSRSPALAGPLPLAPRREAREPLYADRSCPSTSNGCRTCPRRVTIYIKRRASLECKVSGLRLLRGRSGDESAASVDGRVGRACPAAGLRPSPPAMVLRLLILLAVIAAPLEPVEAQYRGTRIVQVKQAKGPKRVKDPAAELARLKRAE